MPKREIRLIKVHENTIIMEGTVGKDYRISIPKQVRQNVMPNSKVKITIEVQK